MPSSRQLRSSDAHHLLGHRRRGTAARWSRSGRCDRPSRRCGRETRRASPRARSMSNACGLVTSWMRCRPMKSCVCPVGSCAHRVRVPDLLEEGLTHIRRCYQRQRFDVHANGADRGGLWPAPLWPRSRVWPGRLSYTATSSSLSRPVRVHHRVLNGPAARRRRRPASRRGSSRPSSPDVVVPGHTPGARVAIDPGTMFGPYQVLASVGAGGMGEVYRARDTRLERTVAIKVLPSHLSASPEVRQRFEREAKTISQLSHPHICAAVRRRARGRDRVSRHGVPGRRDARGQDREGAAAARPAAADRCADRRCARQGAPARDRAPRPEAGQRDAHAVGREAARLRPGEARAVARPATPATAASLRRSPTAAAPHAARGRSSGPFQYMAPEQLEGHEADARTDIFAFGAVLYEMATGQKAVRRRQPGVADQRRSCRRSPRRCRRSADGAAAARPARAGVPREGSRRPRADGARRAPATALDRRGLAGAGGRGRSAGREPRADVGDPHVGALGARGRRGRRRGLAGRDAHRRRRGLRSAQRDPQRHPPARAHRPQQRRDLARRHARRVQRARPRGSYAALDPAARHRRRRTAAGY